MPLKKISVKFLVDRRMSRRRPLPHQGEQFCNNPLKQQHLFTLKKYILQQSFTVAEAIHSSYKRAKITQVKHANQFFLE